MFLLLIMMKLIHYKYKSTEEYIRKYRRGYRWENAQFMKMRIDEYFQDNNITLEKIDYIEKELNLNLSNIRRYYHKKYNITNNITKLY